MHLNQVEDAIYHKDQDEYPDLPWSIGIKKAEAPQRRPCSGGKRNIDS